MAALTKADMAEKLYEELGLNKREAKELVETFFEQVRNALAEGSQVKLSGFGNFLTRSKAERPGRNPKTGEEAEKAGNLLLRNLLIVVGLVVVIMALISKRVLGNK